MLFQLLGGLAIIAAVLLAHSFSLTLPNRQELGPAAVEIRLEPLELDSSRFAPLHLVGAWTLSSDDPRFSGISGLAVDAGHLIALTDSGVVVRFPKPDRRKLRTEVRELPNGPADARFKKNRDSEAMARDRGGRGWWVAFENRDELWLYDSRFRQALQRVAIPRGGLSLNKGVEGMASGSGSELLLFPEKPGNLLRLGRSGWDEVPADYQPRRVSGAAALSEDKVLAIERRLTLLGFSNALVRLDRGNAGYTLAWRKPLPVGRFVNLEAIAVEPGANATRLWLMSDDNSQRPLRTVLIAADLPPQD